MAHTPFFCQGHLGLGHDGLGLQGARNQRQPVTGTSQIRLFCLAWLVFKTKKALDRSGQRPCFDGFRINDCDGEVKQFCKTDLSKLQNSAICMKFLAG